MRYAVFLTFDDTAQSALQHLRERLFQDVKGLPQIAGKLGPHLTLAVFDHNDPSHILKTFHALTATFRSFTITIQAIDFFPGRRKVLFAAPKPSPELQASYERCHAAFTESAFVPAYQDPVNWRPHITLFKGIGGRVFHDAKAHAETNWTPLSAAVQQISLVNVQKPLENLASTRLKTYPETA